MIRIENHDRELCLRIDALIKRLSDVQTPTTPPDYSERMQSISTRLADLEVKVSKMWESLLTKTPTGDTKLNKFGRALQKRGFP